MKANLKNLVTKDTLKTSHKKENSFFAEYSVVAYHKKEFHVPITARFYGNGSNIYCCLWIRDRINSNWIASSGVAGGYGYHKGSAALGDAIQRAGIELSEPIEGRGSTAMEDALKAIAQAMGYKKVVVHHAHA